jgi:hypothetical protein
MWIEAAAPTSLADCMRPAQVYIVQALVEDEERSEEDYGCEEHVSTHDHDDELV